MSSIVVTGAAGFIGSHTCEQLLAAGHAVHGLDNFRTGRRENLRAALAHPHFRFTEMDVTDAARLVEAVTGADAIVHLAALVSVPESISDPATNFHLNVAATQIVADAARARHVRRLVFASSAAVYGDPGVAVIAETTPTVPISPYGGAKLASEALLLGQAPSGGYTVRCLRFFNVYGPRQDPRSPYSGVISIFWAKLRGGETATIFGDGGQTRDFVSVHDVARAVMLAATQPALPSGVTNICSGRGTTVSELAALLRRSYPDAPPPRHAAPRAGDILHSIGAPERAARELGFAASVTLADGLAELVALNHDN